MQLVEFFTLYCVFVVDFATVLFLQKPSLPCCIMNFVMFVQHHPDLNPGDPSSHTKFVRLNEAYSVLSDVTSRREYDLRSVRPTRSRQRSHTDDSHFSRHSASQHASQYRLKACCMYNINKTVTSFCYLVSRSTLIGFLEYFD